MKNRVAVLMGMCWLMSCTTKTNEATPQDAPLTAQEETTDLVFSKPEDAIKNGYVLSEKIQGDLNNDGITDCVLLVKGTQKEAIITLENGTTVDQNRRGILVFFKRKNEYLNVVRNYDCLPSNVPELGVYYAPTVATYVSKNNLYIYYNHGRFGFWKYTFRYLKNGFELIGYDAKETNGSVVNREVSINFMNNKRFVRRNTIETSERGTEQFEDRWSPYYPKKKYYLHTLKNLDGLDLNFD
ncbi:MAG: hypothetical protein RLZZ500_2664 [Bacteroidota bacterium]|jgi:hypothetical protein